MPALWATWRPGKLTGELACLATGKALPQQGNLERELTVEAAGAPVKEVVSMKLIFLLQQVDLT
jgi:hypothetical protein